MIASSPFLQNEVLLKGMTSSSLPSIIDPGVFETVLVSAYTGRLSMADADIVSFLTVGPVLQSFRQMSHVMMVGMGKGLWPLGLSFRRLTACLPVQCHGNAGYT